MSVFPPQAEGHIKATCFSTAKPLCFPVLAQEDIYRHANRGLCTVEILKALFAPRIHAQKSEHRVQETARKLPTHRCSVPPPLRTAHSKGRQLKKKKGLTEGTFFDQPGHPHSFQLFFSVCLLESSEMFGRNTSQGEEKKNKKNRQTIFPAKTIRLKSRRSHFTLTALFRVLVLTQQYSHMWPQPPILSAIPFN